jgi:hypothetical protein
MYGFIFHNRCMHQPRFLWQKQRKVCTALYQAGVLSPRSRCNWYHALVQAELAARLSTRR